MSSDREIVMTRVFDAPRELVFETFTDPKHVPFWWGPKGFTTKVHEMDLRPGGVWRLTMWGPDGTEYKNRIVFKEIARPERLVYTHEPQSWADSSSIEITVTFEAQGDKTSLTMRMVFPTAPARVEAETRHHALEGISQSLSRLGERMAARGHEVSFTRILDAPRDLVFKMWTDAEHLKHWWGPTGFTNPVCEFDPRPGGAIRIHMRAPDGVVYPMTGEVLEIVEPERLVFTSAALDADGNKLFENLNEVTFRDHGAQTELKLHAHVETTTPQGLPYLSGMNEGWKLTLDKLEQYCQANYSNR